MSLLAYDHRTLYTIYSAESENSATVGRADNTLFSPTQSQAMSEHQSNTYEYITDKDRLSSMSEYTFKSRSYKGYNLLYLFLNVSIPRYLLTHLRLFISYLLIFLTQLNGMSTATLSLRLSWAQMQVHIQPQTRSYLFLDTVPRSDPRASTVPIDTWGYNVCV